jgi:hypothetical protein
MKAPPPITRSTLQAKMQLNGGYLASIIMRAIVRTSDSIP